MAEAALTMRDVMSREEEPSFVIKDPIYVKESTNSTQCSAQVFKRAGCHLKRAHLAR